MKSLFDYTKTTRPTFQSKTLPEELFIKQMDEEQVWQQLEMHNASFWTKCMNETCRLLSLNEYKLTLKVNFLNQKLSSKIEKERLGKNISDSIENERFNNQIGLRNLQSTEQASSDQDQYENEGEDQNEDEDEINCEADADSCSDNQNIETQPKMDKISKDSIVDDQFFKLIELEAFLIAEDKKELDRLNNKQKTDITESEDEIDFFDSFSESESNDGECKNGEKIKDIMFADFFDAEEKISETSEQFKQRKNNERKAKNLRKEQEMRKDLGLENSDAESSDESAGYMESQNISYGSDDEIEKSEFDLQQQRLKKRIEELEANALADKPWQLKGEITSSIRPKNSLLEEVLEFDSVARPPPLITEETTFCLEDIIRRRIKAKSWDDVERKIKPINDQQDFRKNLVLNQEKSKESLSQIYEKEYLEKVQKLSNIDDMAKSGEPTEYAGIRKAMKDLFVKLDALSNFHFTSKPVAAEVKVITNIPAIEMEEVAPTAVSDATLLAPEEVRTRPVGDDIGKTERTTTDKKRERRKKKLNQKLIKERNDKRIEEKEKLGIKVTSKEKQQQLMNHVTKGRNIIKVYFLVSAVIFSSQYEYKTILL